MRRFAAGLRIGVGAFAVLFCVAAPAPAQSGANVALVVNDASPASIEVGEYYARKRQVPQTNVIHLSAPIEESVTRADYVDAIERPIASALAERNLQDRVLYIVLTKGVPLKIAPAAASRSDMASVDSELTLLYRRMTGRDALVIGRIDNSYYAGSHPPGELKPFTHREQDIYLVTRLDGFSVADVLALIDRGAAPAREGRILLDRPASPSAASRWLEETASALEQVGQGDRAEVVNRRADRTADDSLLGYFSWGSNDPDNHRRRLGLRFGAGALAATLAGADARTFATPPDSWVPDSRATDRTKVFADAPQSLIGDLIQDGVTGVAGNVADPLLASAVRPQILFAAYLSGFNLAESFYLALPHLSWQSVVIGDPLCRPFEGRTLTSADLDIPGDAVTGLPAYFAQRRIAVVRERLRTAPDAAIPLMVRAERQLSADDRADARATLEKVVDLSPDFIEPHLLLAALDEDAGDFAGAVRRYRRVLEIEPRNVGALNNLAYRIAVDQHAPEEALPIARRAASLAPKDPRVLDTLGWINHLLGRSVEAVRLLTEALRTAPAAADIRLHAAFALAATASFKAAESHLNEAIRLAPDLASRPDVQALRETLAKRR